MHKSHASLYINTIPNLFPSDWYKLGSLVRFIYFQALPLSQENWICDYVRPLVHCLVRFFLASAKAQRRGCIPNPLISLSLIFQLKLQLRWQLLLSRQLQLQLPGMYTTILWILYVHLFICLACSYIYTAVCSWYLKMCNNILKQGTNV